MKTLALTLKIWPELFVPTRRNSLLACRMAPRPAGGRARAPPAAQAKLVIPPPAPWLWAPIYLALLFIMAAPEPARCLLHHQGAPSVAAARPFVQSRQLAAAPPPAQQRRSLARRPTKEEAEADAERELAEENKEQAALRRMEGQLGLLRKQFDESRSGASNWSARRRQAALGAPCTQSKQCSAGIENSHCQLETLSCECLNNFVQLNSTTCLPSKSPPAELKFSLGKTIDWWFKFTNSTLACVCLWKIAANLLGFSCQIDAQCRRRVANSVCDPSRRVCTCEPNYLAHRRDKCLEGESIEGII